MMLEIEHLVAREQRKDAMAFAEQQRLARLVLAGRPSFTERYQQWLAELEAQLVKWGRHLQARYADALTVSTVLPQECREMEGKA